MADSQPRGGASRLGALRQKAAELPAQPGVYLMKGTRGEVLYVGKAKSLRARVRTYFSGGGDGRAQITYLLRRVHELDVLVTATEKEAIILENNLIKKHKPRYNIIFRDDKTYLHVRLSVRDPWPRLTTLRRPKKDGSKYYGPYASAHSLRQTIEEIQRIFPLRTCSDYELANRARPCIEYEIGRCRAPCVGLVDEERYGEMVGQVDLYLRGRKEEAIAALEREMQVASGALEYERAAELRDRIAAVRQTLERQRVDVMEDVSRDAIALIEVGEEVWIQLLFVREGRVIESHGYPLKRHLLELPEVLFQFLIQYYSDERHCVPEEILLPLTLDAAAPLAEWLGERRGGRVVLIRPKRGRRRELLDMAESNAREAVALRYEASQRQERLLEDLKERLSLARFPRRIECFDVSHLQGGACAASQVTFVNGEPEKSLYRKYELRGVPPGDDYQGLGQVLTRRYRKALPAEEGEPVPEAERLPELIVVDGGKGQLGVLEEVLASLGITGRAGAPERACLAKSRVLGPGSRSADFGRSDERVFVPGRSEALILPQDSQGLLLLAHLRDESHRFALAYHRRLRARLKFRSALDDVPGIGKKRRVALLKHFGTVSAVKEASEETLAACPTMNKKTAAAVRQWFHGKEAAESEAETEGVG